MFSYTGLVQLMIPFLICAQTQQNTNIYTHSEQEMTTLGHITLPGSPTAGAGLKAGR